MYYTVYKITNIINNKIYIGCHKTEDLNDQYMGSGKILKRSIEKYGIESFNKEYLKIFDNKEDMFEMELILVNDDFIKEATNYNLKVGGEGGWDYTNKNNLTKNAHKKGKYKNIYFGDCEWHDVALKNAHSSDAIKKRKKTQEKIKFQQGKNNSQYGTMWIYSLDLKENKKIKKDSIIPDGWNKGRKSFS